MQMSWNLLWQVDKDEDDPEFSSPSSAPQPPRTHTDIVEDMLTQLSKAEGYFQMLHQEFGSLGKPSAPATGEGSRIRADGGDDDDDIQIEVIKLVIDDEERAPSVPADLSTRVVFVSCINFIEMIIL